MCNVLILHKNDSILDTYGSVHRSVCACVVDDPNRTRLRPVAFDHLRLGGSLNDRKVVARLGFLNVAHRTLLDGVAFEWRQAVVRRGRSHSLKSKHEHESIEVERLG